MKYHYTVKLRLDSILADGLIKCATEGVFGGERPAVWFTTNPTWEETANKAVDNGFGRESLTRDQTHEVFEGLVRIAVADETAPHDWNAYRRLSGVSPKMANALRTLAYRAGSKLGEWFISFEPVPRDLWLAVEIWDGEKWGPFPENWRKD
jgi:hypothetical protein